MVVACDNPHIQYICQYIGERDQNEGIETLMDPVVGTDARNRHRHKAGLTAMLPRTEYLVNALTE